MPHKRRGRKIYTYRAKYRRVFSKYHPMRSAFGIILTLVLAVFAGIVGYSVIAPVYERLTAEAESPTSVPDPFDPSAVADAVTGLVQTSATTASDTAETTTEVTTTRAVAPLTFDEDTVLIYCVPDADMTDLSALEQTAVSASNLGYSALAYPLKTAGGMLTYASSVEAANISGASQEEFLTLNQLYELAEENGLACMALFNTLNDQTYPAVFQDGAYIIADSGQRWLDMTFEDGGKPWLSPFSPQAQSYLISLASEISNAGFTRLFCTDLIFPQLFDSDLSALDEALSDPAQRAEALALVLGGIAESAQGAVYMFDFQDAVSDSAEALRSDSLTIDAYCIRFDLTEIPDTFTWNGISYETAGQTAAERMSRIYPAAQQVTADRSLYPCVVRGDMTDEELADALHVLYDAGCRVMLVSEQ